MKTLEFIDGKYVFEHNGMNICNPIMSDCGRGAIDPSAYGFTVHDMGGGHWVHAQPFSFEGKRVLMILSDGDGSGADLSMDWVYITLYDATNSVDACEVVEQFDLDAIAAYEVTL
jgi:hypothetical protein